MNSEQKLAAMTTQQLEQLERTVQQLLKMTKQADCIPIYVAAMHGLRAELEARQAAHEEVRAGLDANGSS